MPAGLTKGSIEGDNGPKAGEMRPAGPLGVDSDAGEDIKDEVADMMGDSGSGFGFGSPNGWGR